MNNRGERRDGIKKLEKGLSELIKAAEAQNNESVEDSSKQEQEDLNIIPFPLSQKVRNGKTYGYIEWVWEPVGLGIKIFGILYTQDSVFGDGNGDTRDQGTYEVQLSIDNPVIDRGSNVFVFNPEVAKAIGHSMISAYKWKDIWKEHAGKYMELELFGYGTE